MPKGQGWIIIWKHVRKCWIDARFFFSIRKNVDIFQVAVFAGFIPIPRFIFFRGASF
jgi:hypothetical protein